MIKTLILIPSRLGAKRLPGKPLLKINNLSIISHVVKIAKKAKVGDVYVATDSIKIKKDVQKNGGRCVLTKKTHKTGTDRIYEAFKKLKKKNINYIINLQGDEPNIKTEDIKNLNKLMYKNKSEIGTLATLIRDKNILSKKNFVKVKTEKPLKRRNFSRAINFFRNLNKKKKITNIYHHKGIYAFSVNALTKINSLQRSKNEKKYKLEQLRAIDNNIKINVSLSRNLSFGVDTLQDYIDIKKIMEYK